MDVQLARAEFASALNNSNMAIHASVALKSTALLLTHEVGFLVRGSVTTSNGKTFKAPAILNRTSVQGSKDAIDIRSASDNAAFLILNRADFPADVGDALLHTTFTPGERVPTLLNTNKSSGNRAGRKRQASAWSRFQSHKF